MELDDFKNLLNEKFEKSDVELGSEKIHLSLQEKTNSVLYKLKKGVWFELTSTITAIIIFAVLSFLLSNKGLRIYFGTFALVIVAFIPVFVRFLRMINNQMLYVDAPVKENLTTLIASIKLYMKRYKQFSLLLIPVCISYAFLLGYNTDGHFSQSYIVNQLTNSGLNETVIILLILTLISVLAVAVHYINKWYLNLIYGRYLSELESAIASLNENK
ncbi:MAG: hypothetical protein C0459_09675 [Chitinophaga sp.]|jgi:hypothetical protein|nr:hypothetical protein [Chitinophaga sp.]